MKEEKGGGGRQLEVPEVTPSAAPQRRGHPGTGAASQAGGAPTEARQRRACASVSPFSAGLGRLSCW